MEPTNSEKTKIFSLEEEVMASGYEKMRKEMTERLQGIANDIGQKSTKTGRIFKKTKKTKLELNTTFGNVEIGVLYGQDPETKIWGCPFREMLELTQKGHVTPLLAEKLCYTATRCGSYEAAEEVAQKWGTKIDDSTIHREVQRAGSRAAALREERVKRAHDTTQRKEVEEEAGKNLPKIPFSLVIMMDGWMIRERGEDWGLKPENKLGDRVEWHESKTATIFNLAHRGETQSGRRFIIERYYESFEGSPEEFGRYVYAEALRRGLAQAEKVYVVADGAVWIWNLAKDRFPTAIGVLDYYHASQHLWAVAHELFPEDEKKARKWVRPLLRQMKEGKEAKVIKKLDYLLQNEEQKGANKGVIARECNYFEGHAEHLHYKDVAADGCPKGSGAIESTCSQLQNRFKRTGQYWARIGKDMLMVLELARRNQDWNAIWAPAA